MLRQIIIAPPAGYPLFGWTEKTVKTYILEKPLLLGDHMISYNGQSGLHHYSLATVENAALGKQKRILLSKAGAYGGTTFYRSGKNCFSPTGQSRMLPPVPALMGHLNFTMEVWLDISAYSKGV